MDGAKSAGWGRRLREAVPDVREAIPAATQHVMGDSVDGVADAMGDSVDGVADVIAEVGVAHRPTDSVEGVGRRVVDLSRRAAGRAGKVLARGLTDVPRWDADRPALVGDREPPLSGGVVVGPPGSELGLSPVAEPRAAADPPPGPAAPPPAPRPPEAGVGPVARVAAPRPAPPAAGPPAAVEPGCDFGPTYALPLLSEPPNGRCPLKAKKAPRERRTTAAPAMSAPVAPVPAK